MSLGDSYSSGEGNPTFDAGTDTKTDTCHRSPVAWPRLLGITKSSHLACSGAIIKNLFSGQTAGSPDDIAQLTRLRAAARKTPTSAVVITIGGNDVGFAAILGDCFVRECLAHPEKNTADIDRAVDQIRTRVIPAIASAAPGAKVVLVGYPRLFPTSTAATTRCGWLTPRELQRTDTLQAYFDSKAADAAHAAGATYVSVLDALAGHELCSRNCRGNTLCGHPHRRLEPSRPTRNRRPRRSDSRVSQCAATDELPDHE